jgi:enoyl-CoA hydratase/carnithine racemase
MRARRCASGWLARVVPRLQLDRVVRSMTDALCAKGPIALRLAKEAVVAGLDLTLDQGIRLEQDLYVLLQTTGDRREGIEAFRAKRRPTFRGR